MSWQHAKDRHYLVDALVKQNRFGFRVLGKGLFQDLDDGIRKTGSSYHELYEVILEALLCRWDCDEFHLNVPLETRQASAFDYIDRIYDAR